jgi:hypothetical protein
MPRSESRAWWADVEDVRASIEHRRELEARDATRAREAAGRETGRTRLTVVSDDAANGRRATGRAADGDGADDPTAPRRAADRRASRFAEVGDAGPALRPAPGGDLDRSGRERRGRRADEAGGTGPALRPTPGGDLERSRKQRRGRRADEAGDAGSALRPAPGADLDRSGRERRARPGPLAASPARRRTVEITGRTVGAPSLPRLVEIDRRRPARRPVERVGPRPDRVAMWAVILGFFLIVVAFTSASHAATSAPARAATAPAAKAHADHVSVAVAVRGGTVRATP